MHIIQSLKSYEAAARLPRATLKGAMRSLFGAAWRLHHYKDVHTSMMREVFCELDCGNDARQDHHE